MRISFSYFLVLIAAIASFASAQSPLSQNVAVSGVCDGNTFTYYLFIPTQGRDIFYNYTAFKNPSSTFFFSYSTTISNPDRTNTPANSTTVSSNTNANSNVFGGNFVFTKNLVSFTYYVGVGCILSNASNPLSYTIQVRSLNRNTDGLADETSYNLAAYYGDFFYYSYTPPAGRNFLVTIDNKGASDFTISYGRNPYPSGNDRLSAVTATRNRTTLFTVDSQLYPAIYFGVNGNADNTPYTLSIKLQSYTGSLQLSERIFYEFPLVGVNTYYAVDCQGFDVSIFVTSIVFSSLRLNYAIDPARKYPTTMSGTALTINAETVSVYRTMRGVTGNLLYIGLSPSRLPANYKLSVVPNVPVTLNNGVPYSFNVNNASFLPTYLNFTARAQSYVQVDVNVSPNATVIVYFSRYTMYPNSTIAGREFFLTFSGYGGSYLLDPSRFPTKDAWYVSATSTTQNLVVSVTVTDVTPTPATLSPGVALSFNTTTLLRFFSYSFAAGTNALLRVTGDTSRLQTIYVSTKDTMKTPYSSSVATTTLTRNAGTADFRYMFDVSTSAAGTIYFGVVTSLGDPQAITMTISEINSEPATVPSGTPVNGVSIAAGDFVYYKVRAAQANSSMSVKVTSSGTVSVFQSGVNRYPTSPVSSSTEATTKSGTFGVIVAEALVYQTDYAFIGIGAVTDSVVSFNVTTIETSSIQLDYDNFRTGQVISDLDSFQFYYVDYRAFKPIQILIVNETYTPNVTSYVGLYVSSTNPYPVNSRVADYAIENASLPYRYTADYTNVQDVNKIVRVYFGIRSLVPFTTKFYTAGGEVNTLRNINLGNGNGETLVSGAYVFYALTLTNTDDIVEVRTASNSRAPLNCYVSYNTAIRFPASQRSSIFYHESQRANGFLLLDTRFLPQGTIWIGYGTNQSSINNQVALTTSSVANRFSDDASLLVYTTTRTNTIGDGGAAYYSHVFHTSGKYDGLRITAKPVAGGGTTAIYASINNRTPYPQLAEFSIIGTGTVNLDIPQDLIGSDTKVYFSVSPMSVASVYDITINGTNYDPNSAAQASINTGLFVALVSTLLAAFATLF